MILSHQSSLFPTPTTPFNVTKTSKELQDIITRRNSFKKQIRKINEKYIAPSIISIITQLVVSAVLFTLAGFKAVRHGHLYRALLDARDHAIAKGQSKFTTRRVWGLWWGIDRVHLALDIQTSKQVLSKRDNFEKFSSDAKDGLGGSLLFSGDDPKYWAELKKLLLRQVVPSCIEAAKNLSVDQVQMTCNDDEPVDLYNVLFDWVISYQFKIFLDYDVVLEHPNKKGYFFRQVLDSFINGLNKGNNTSQDEEWLHEQIHAAMKSSLQSNRKDCMGKVMAEACPERHYQNTHMVFIALTSIYTLFWSILEHVKDPSASPEDCFDAALRSHSPVPFMFPRKAKKDIMIGSNLIKKGDQVVVSQLVVNEQSKNGDMIPFGYDAHTCLMKYFAKELIPNVLGHLFDQYDIAVVENHAFLDKPREMQMTGTGAAFSRPAERVKVVFTKKKKNNRITRRTFLNNDKII